MFKLKAQCHFTKNLGLLGLILFFVLVCAYEFGADKTAASASVPESGSHRAAVLQDGVAEAAVALRPQILPVGAPEEQGLLQCAARLVPVGHAVAAVVGDVLVGGRGQHAQELQLHCHHVPRLIRAPVPKLKSPGIKTQTFVFVGFFIRAYRRALTYDTLLFLHQQLKR